MKGVKVEDVQADELWTYVRCKQATRERRKIADPDAGDAYCYIGLERTSKRAPLAGLLRGLRIRLHQRIIWP